jgi:hypothetical protein
MVTGFCRVIVTGQEGPLSRTPGTDTPRPGGVASPGVRIRRRAHLQRLAGRLSDGGSPKHSAKEAAVEAAGGVAAVGMKLVHLTKGADKGVRIFHVVSSGLKHLSIIGTAGCSDIICRLISPRGSRMRRG